MEETRNAIPTRFFRVSVEQGWRLRFRGCLCGCLCGCLLRSGLCTHLLLRRRLKKWTERMKFGTNSVIFLPFSAFLGHFLWESRDISSFSENIREILIRFHQNFAEKWPNSLTKVGMKFHFISFYFIPTQTFNVFLLEFWSVSGAKAKKSCRARKMLKKMSLLSLS